MSLPRQFGKATLDVKAAEIFAENINMMVPYYLMASYCLLYTSPSPRDRQKSRMPSSA